MDIDKKHKKYQSLYKLIKSGVIKGFDDVLPVVTKSRLRRDLGFSSKGIDNRLNDARHWTFMDVDKLCKLTGCDYLDITQIIVNDMNAQKSLREKS